MFITIVRSERFNDSWLIEFSCSCGNGTGRWIGPRPSCAQGYWVEFDVEERLQLGINASYCDTPAPSISNTGGVLTLVATLEQVNENGTAVCRLGSDLLFVEFDGPFLEVGDWLSIRPRQLIVNDCKF